MSYLRDLAEAIRSELPHELVPDDADELFLVYALLALVKGKAVTAEDVHNAWVAWMEMRGERHESMVRFADLTRGVRAEDDPFVTAIRTVATRHRPTS
jgi:hypothetical protein